MPVNDLNELEMKKLIYLSALLSLVLLFGCKKDDGLVQIDSVFKNGSEFFSKAKSSCVGRCPGQ